MLSASRMLLCPLEGLNIVSSHDERVEARGKYLKALLFGD